MMTGVVAAFALVVVGVVLFAVRYLNLRSGRQAEAILRRIDGHLEAISMSVGQAVDRIVEARGSGPQLLPTLDFDALVEHAPRRGGGAHRRRCVVLRVEGPGGRPVVASFGEGTDAEPLEQSFDPPDRRSFRAATVDWTYAPFADAETAPFRSALVAPFDIDGEAPGAVAVFSRSHDAFRAEQAGTLRALVEEAGVALANARRFAEVEARAFLDPASGVPDRRGYEIELERAVARARRTGKPLTVAIVALEDGVRAERRGNGFGELARLVGRVTRGSDVSCRRGGQELAILLPETRESEASRLTVRLREEAQTGARSLGSDDLRRGARGVAPERVRRGTRRPGRRGAAADRSSRSRPARRVSLPGQFRCGRTRCREGTGCAPTPSRSSPTEWTNRGDAPTP